MTDTAPTPTTPAASNGPGGPTTVIRVSMVLMGIAIVVVLILRVLVARERELRLPVIGTVPAFELVDQTGSLMSSTELAGKVWVASFIYTTCPGPCPRVVGRLAELDRRLGGQPRFRLVSFSVDPEADTPEVLAAYATTHAIAAARWKLLTGPVEPVMTLIRQGFLLPVQKAEGLSPEEIARVGPVVHSLRLVLVDAEGRMRGHYDSDNPDELDRLAHDAVRLMR